jgi:hypothetical protein
MPKKLHFLISYDVMLEYIFAIYIANIYMSWHIFFKKTPNRMEMIFNLYEICSIY